MKKPAPVESESESDEEEVVIVKKKKQIRRRVIVESDSEEEPVEKVKPIVVPEIAVPKQTLIKFY